MSLFRNVGNVMCHLYDKLYVFLEVMCLGVRRCPVLILNVYIYISCSTADLMGIMNDRTHI